MRKVLPFRQWVVFSLLPQATLSLACGYENFAFQANSASKKVLAIKILCKRSNGRRKVVAGKEGKKRQKQEIIIIYGAPQTKV
ncbi:MAG: hypothetical protein LBU22_13355 [Dysgonamonadaceae bacterium]|nr:hypothetical protein [Dysgonamonadaceae bacterium]